MEKEKIFNTIAQIGKQEKKIIQIEKNNISKIALGIKNAKTDLTEKMKKAQNERERRIEEEKELAIKERERSKKEFEKSINETK